ncbi:MAG: class I adenylate-forming enzyme family protein, partial [Acidimicrobiia bacterium]
GDRVALVADAGLVYFDVYLAAAWIGAAVVPVNTRLAGPEGDYIVGHAEPALAVADAAHLDLLPAGAPFPVVDCGSDAYAEMAAGDPVAVDAEDRDVALIIYTSGTTGRPKGVCLTQAALAFNALASGVGQRFVPDDVFLSLTPLYHAACATRVYTMLLDGQCNLVLPRFDEARALRAMEEHGVTSTLVVPVQLRRLVECPSFAATDLSRLRLVMYGAAPTDDGLIERARAAFGKVLHQGYGLSEAVTNLTAFGPEDHELIDERPELLGSCGRVTPGVAIELRDGDGRVVPDGEVGEIWVRTDKVMAGYWRDPAATAETVVDGWLRTGDLARRTADGYFFIAGRAKDMLISGGVNIYPLEIEAVLYEHPSVVDAGVIGVPDERWGEVPAAFVTLRPGAAWDEAEVRAFCEQRLSRIKVPSRFTVIDEFPRTENGKIRKRDLAVSDPDPTVAAR